MVSAKRPVLKNFLVVCRVGGFFTHPVPDSIWNLSRRSAGGDFLLHAPYLNLSGRTSGGKSILHALSWHLSRRSSGEEFLLHAPSSFVSRLGLMLECLFCGFVTLVQALYWNMSQRSVCE